MIEPEEADVTCKTCGEKFHVRWPVSPRWIQAAIHAADEKHRQLSPNCAGKLNLEFAGLPPDYFGSYAK